MKKIIMAFSAACIALGFAACTKTSSSASTADDKFVDSLSEISGTLNGSGFARQIETLSEADQAKFNKTAFLKGLKAAYLTDTADLGYIIGMQVGLNILTQNRQMAENGVNTNRNLFYEAFSKAFQLDSLPEAQSKELQEQFQALMNKANMIMTAKQDELRKAALQKQEAENQANLEAGKAYVDSLKATDPTIKTTESGLSYKIEKEGQGAKATDNDRVKVKYTGRLINGEVFDSNEGVEFSPKGVVPGFGEGLKMMNKGSKYILYIPGNLGYGANGAAGGKITPGATLVFEVEVLDITPEKK